MDGRPSNQSVSSGTKGMVLEMRTLQKPRQSGLQIIFNNPILLSSLVQNFDRKDYHWLAELAATIPGIEPWPKWEPLSQPLPFGTLAFSVKDLRVRCQNSLPEMPRLMAVKSSHAVHSEGGCKELEGAMSWKGCGLTERDQGLPPKSNIHREGPLEFFECIGHRLKIRDLPLSDIEECLIQLQLVMEISSLSTNSIRAAVRLLQNDGPQPVLVDLHGLHGSEFMVCSKCALDVYLSLSVCIWDHARIVPLCRECSENPSRELYKFEAQGMPSIAENIRGLRNIDKYLECDCHEVLSPGNGYHLCTFCAAMFHVLIYLQHRLNKASGIYPDSVPYQVLEMGNTKSGYGRNYCPCGKDWHQLVDSWCGISQEERDNRMYRLCTLCTGHIPRGKMMNPQSTNCL
ncbi:hypothetical protein Z517_05124 [Fonsecaea pedrosoi CBS 271.37]|uniref:Uncharacterized protein n=1 Tax=Fonsecaea pedrosoi CBS 271.37 TaxID=1442368 RepID=A0A0D2F5Z2_9EURO|nr:uncharacterized protein Z517_05124 [Fonsecaea pedrosoi CBS 271.37]KIW82097.1 hypothetical protein Z517_05124 [Fonsecaea pedrosoi CBS 271.37]